MTERFAYRGDPALRPGIEQALKRVIDPEMAVDIVELGLVYGVEHRDGQLDVRITMTSPACPVTGLIADDVGRELDRAFGMTVLVEVVWDPPWAPEMMSDRARTALGWG